MADPIQVYYSKLGVYPANNRQWWAAKADSDDPDKGVKQGDFLPEILDKIFSGNNHAPRGHYILNEFYKDRSGVSGISNLTPVITDERPSTVTFFSGRAWFACNTSVYFSQLMTGKQKAGLCYQEADPTSEDISDLIATDGGVIPIPETSKIVRILSNSVGVLVFAYSGVWFISGTQSGFSALDLTVNKISPIGCRNPKSIVETEDTVFWWSDTGVMAASFNGGGFSVANISQDTIQSFYNDIPEISKTSVKSVFDPKANRILWLYNSDVDQHSYDSILFFDTSLKAFYPWKVSNYSDDPVNNPRIKGVYVSEKINQIQLNNDVTASGIDVLSNGIDVTVGSSSLDLVPSAVNFTVLWGRKFYNAESVSTSFMDWKSVDGTGLSYDSYIEAGYELMNDAMRNKAITYIFTYMKQTETTWSDPDSPSVDDPSSCYMQIKFDWANSVTSNKWTTPVQIYRQGRFIGMNVLDYDTGFPIVVAKNKVRGNGKSIQFRFGTSEPGKNFDLHGWSVALTGNTTA